LKSLHRHLLTFGLMASLGFGAMAQPQTPPAGPAGAPTAPHAQAEQGRHDPARLERFRARMQERMAARTNALKQKLQITAAQEGAWTNWTGAMKPVRMQRPDRAEWQRLSTPERIDRMRAMRAARSAEADRRGEATKTLYAALSPEQKRVFDTESLRFGRGGHHGGKGEHGRHHRG
jgi:protein CpxP